MRIFWKWWRTPTPTSSFIILYLNLNARPPTRGWGWGKGGRAASQTQLNGILHSHFSIQSRVTIAKKYNYCSGPVIVTKMAEIIYNPINYFGVS